jgi:hypothetical protein
VSTRAPAKSETLSRIFGLEDLASTLPLSWTEQNVSNFSKSRLYRYRDFYRFYPQMVATLSPLFSDRFSVLEISKIPVHVIRNLDEQRQALKGGK